LSIGPSQYGLSAGQVTPAHALSWLVEQGLTSHSTQFRSFRRWCFYSLHVRWPNQQCQSTEGGWLVIQIALNLTRLISPCYN